MRIYLLLLIVLLLPFGLYAQADCRVRLEDLRPLILGNPRFSNYSWKETLKIETARLDPYRTLLIAQDGCVRKQTTFTLTLQQPAIVSLDGWFWLRQSQEMFEAVYPNRVVYNSFKTEFERAFAAKFAEVGFNKNFNFPVMTRNFICEVIYNPPSEARIWIQMVEYVFREQVKQ